MDEMVVVVPGLPLAGARVLICGSDGGAAPLVERLGELGADVLCGLDTLVERRLRWGRVDVVALTTPAAVLDLLRVAASPPCRIATTDPVTSATCAEHGLPVHAEASAAGTDALVRAVVAAARARGVDDAPPTG
jgi:uroporphyrinogen-III synthase